MSHTQSAVKQSVESTLRIILPALDVDFAVIADEIIERLDMAAIKHMEARESALHSMLQKLMDYYGSEMMSYQERIDHLERERKVLHLKLAKLTVTKDS